MKFQTNKISVGGGKSFQEFVDSVLAKKTAKTASVETPIVKEAAAPAPKVEKPVEKVAAKEKDEAETSGQPQAEAKLVNCPEKPKTKTTGKADNKPAESSGQPEAEAKLVNDPHKGEKSEKKEEKKAEVAVKITKVAKLNAETRSWLKDYWRTLFGEEYAEAMVAEH